MALIQNINKNNFTKQGEYYSKTGTVNTIII